ncbi:MAG TPA: zf-HC2 domain-containing protein [Gaiellaceae bacterium]|jgi:anti-sigma factor (TIGR02949 family)|nr:zf-HC2 domain-containing protein [Gaiellaceae bacterium]
MTAIDLCDWCEQVIQEYVDRELTEAEMKEAESHLETCSHCRKRYLFEASLRRYVRQSVPAMSPEMKARLSALRIEL